jgi:dienelactone hydrolase
MSGRTHAPRAVRRAVFTGAVLALAVALSATATKVDARSARRSGTKARPTEARVLGTTVVASAPASVTRPTVTGVVVLPRRTSPPAGARPTGPSTFWKVTTPDGSQFTLEKYDAPGPGPHPTVVMFPGTAGWTTADEPLAAAIARLGFTTVTLCWFRTPEHVERAISCPDARPFVGVSWDTVPAISSLVDAVKRLPDVDPTRVALSGFSRGAGEVLLYATLGGPEPVIAVSGLTSPDTFPTLPSETDVVQFAGGIRAPTFFLYGVDDAFVKPYQNSIAMAAAIRDAGRAPEPRISAYRGGHSIETVQSRFGPAPDAYRVIRDQVHFLRSTLTRARTIAARPAGGYYTLFEDGRVVPHDGAVFYGEPSWPGFETARDLAVMPDGAGYVVLEANGSVHAFGSARSLPLDAAPKFDDDLARGIAVTPSGAGYAVLDAWGGLHPAGDAPRPRNDGYRPGRDVARDLAVTPDGRGYLVLDRRGRVRKLGTAAALRASIRDAATDARQLVVSTTGNAFGVLDGTGTLSLSAGLRAPARASTTRDTDWVGVAQTTNGWVALARDRSLADWG